MRRLSVAMLLGLFAVALHGQNPNVAVSGRVTDPSEAIISHAKGDPNQSGNQHPLFPKDQ
jgi:hypothetical protein